MIQEKIGQAAHSRSITTGERLIGVIPDVYKGKTFGGRDSFDLIVTANRLIFVYLQTGEGQ